MKPRNVNESNVPSLNQVIFGVVIFVVGVIILIISNLTNWKSGNPWGFTLISIGLPFILWRMYDWLKTLEFFKVRQLMIEAKKHNIDIFKIMPLVKKTEDIDIHKIVSLMKRENFIDINKDITFFSEYFETMNLGEYFSIINNCHHKALSSDNTKT